MLQVEVMTAVVVVGQNSEYSDIVNPRGLQYGDQHALVVIDTVTGERWVGPTVKSANSGLVRALQRSIDKGHNPTKSAAFQPMEPVYGSHAYQVGGYEGELAQMERSGQFGNDPDPRFYL